MKTITLMLVTALISVVLIGCQYSNETAEAEDSKIASASNENDQLIGTGEIIKVEVSKTKGFNPVIFEEPELIGKFTELFLSSSREPGTVNVTAPEFYLKLIDKEGNVQRLQLWMGSKGEQSILMNSANTNTIYTLPPDSTAELFALIEK